MTYMDVGNTELIRLVNFRSKVNFRIARYPEQRESSKLVRSSMSALAI